MIVYLYLGGVSLRAWCSQRITASTPYASLRKELTYAPGAGPLAVTKRWPVVVEITKPKDP